MNKEETAYFPPRKAKLLFFSVLLAEASAIVTLAAAKLHNNI
jgi:hypothetical protein